jgi:hypothetical protein
MREIQRVLTGEGSLFLKVPFLYPIHDAPSDFHRWTSFGLCQLAKRHGFRIVKQRHIGDPLETAALLANIAFSKAVLRWIRAFNVLMVLGLLLPPAIILFNLIAALASGLSSSDEMMPHGYFLILQKIKPTHGPT